MRIVSRVDCPLCVSTSAVNMPLSRYPARHVADNLRSSRADTENIDATDSNNYSNIFSNDLMSRKNLNDDEFKNILSEVMKIEIGHNKMRRQFLMRLVETKFFEMNGPVINALTRQIQEGSLTNTPASEILKSSRLLLELLEEFLIRIPHYKGTFAYVSTIFAMMRLIPGIETSLGENMREVESALTEPELLMNITHDQDVSWSTSFMTEPILPPIHKLLNEPLHERYVNIVKGPYQSAAHYIETWFRLMQEDFISPLRTAIIQYKQARTLDEEDINMRLDGGYYYRFIKILSTERSRGEVIQLLRFSMEKLQSIDWSTTERLRTESLVIFSSDNFENAVYGVVHSPEDNRPPKRGTVWVRMVGGPLQFTGSFDGIEAMPYYEPYRCVLDRLKVMAMSVDYGVALPMEDYLIRCDTAEVYPEYITATTTLMLKNGGTVQIGELAQAISMDDSQREALQFAFTNKLALIQGPPGTGKSYVGANVVDILMANTNLWQKHGQGCILLMAFTNHAIDQFIIDCEKMGIDMSRTVRIGSRGNNSIQKYGLHNRRGEWKREKTISDMAKKFHEIYTELKLSKTFMTRNEAIMSWADWQDVPYEAYVSCIGDHCRDQILAWYETLDQNVILEWIRDGTTPGMVDHSLDESPLISSDEVWRLENKSITELSFIERKCLLRFWCEAAQSRAKKRLTKNKVDVDELKIKLANCRRQQDIAVVQRCNIIALTTSGACKHSHLVEAVKPTIVLVEEAAEVLESHIVAPLTTGCKHIILIGDHQQLRPGVAEFQLEKRNLSISLFERLVLNNQPNRRLNVQHRMHPEIASLLVPHIYPSLMNHDKVYEFPPVKGVSQRMVFLCHENHEIQVGEKSSKQNEFEADYLVHLCRYLLQQGYSPTDITILVTYAGQQQMVKTKIEHLCYDHPGPLYTVEEKQNALAALAKEFCDAIIALNRKKYGGYVLSNQQENRINEYFEKRELIDKKICKLEDVRVSTVDNYQGEESKIILLSFVRSNAQCNIGFLKWSNRICVALSRAQHGFYAVGNFMLFAKNQKSDLWKKLCTQMNSNPDKSKCVLRTALRITCQNHGTERFVTEGKSFIELAPEGGCTEVCIYRLKCGHKCTKSCHLDDQDHVTFTCEHPCPGLLSCGHICGRACSKDGDGESVSISTGGGVYRQCTNCEKNIYCLRSATEEQPCGHTPSDDTKCSALPNYKCVAATEFRLTCGHSQKAACCSNVSELKCQTKICDTLTCGHEIVRECGGIKVPGGINICEKLVQVQLACGHHKSVRCDASNDEHLCTILVHVNLPCGHICQIECFKSNKPINCKEVVTRKLSCHHTQTKLCHEEWTELSCTRTVEVVLNCGHKCKTECYNNSVVSLKCQEMVTAKLVCGHEIQCMCHKIDQQVCIQKVRIRRKCGHYKRTKCTQAAMVQQGLCDIRIQKKLACGHSVSQPCYNRESSPPNCHTCLFSDNSDEESGAFSLVDFLLKL